MSENPPKGTHKGADEKFGAAAHERPVPRISIHAFCELPDTGAAIQRAASDRRLSKANVNVLMGGMPAAAEYFASNASPNLIVVETRSESQAVIEELDKLAGVCDEKTKVLVIGHVNDVQLYRELVRRGVSEYLVGPLNPLQIIESISGLYVNPNAPPIGRVIAFVGARGGAGSSTIAHNLGWMVAEQFNIETVIADFDLPFGTVGLNFNQDPGQGIADALAQPERLDDVLLDRLLSKCGDHLSLFAAPAMLDRDYNVSSEAFEGVIDKIRQSVPCVIVDVPRVWTPAVRQTLLAADEIVIVAPPDLASLRNGKNFVDVLKSGRSNDHLPKLVLNQAGIPKRPEISAKEFGEAMGIEPAVVVPYEPQLFGTAANNGQMVVQAQPNSRPAQAIRKLAEILTGRVVQPIAPAKKVALLPFLSRKAG